MTRFRLAYLIVALALVAAACGQPDNDIQATAGQNAAGLNSQAVPADSGDGTVAEATDNNDGQDGPTSDPDVAGSDDPAESATADSTTTTADSTAADGAAAATTLDSAEGQLMLASVVSETEAASTGRFEGRITLGMDPSAGASDVNILLTGSFDMATGATEMSIDLTQITDLLQATPDSSGGEDPLMMLGMFPGMFDDPIRFVSVDDRSFIQWPFLASLFASFSPDFDPSIPAGELWIEGTSEDLDGAADSLGATGLTEDVLPTDLLDQLRDAEATVEEIGPDTVRGVATTHYRVTLDAEAMAAASGEELSADELAELGAVDGMPMDLWVDDQGLARKILIEVDESMMVDETDASSDALGSDATDEMPISSMTMEFELFDLGQPVTITAPPEDRILASDGLGLDSSGFGS